METMTKTAVVSNTKIAVATVLMLGAGAAAFILAPEGSAERVQQYERCRDLNRACESEGDSPGPACDAFWTSTNPTLAECEELFRNPPTQGQLAVTNMPDGSTCNQNSECVSTLCQGGQCVAATIDLTIRFPNNAPTTAGLGDAFSIGTQVCNTGTRSTPSQVAVGGNVIQGDGTSDLRTFYVGPIESGACVDSPSMTIAQTKVGLIRVSFWVDANNQVAETNENNNLVNTNIMVNSPAGTSDPCPQPIVGSPYQCATAYGNCVKYTTTHRNLRYYQGSWQSLCRACIGGALNASTNNCQRLPDALPPAPAATGPMCGNGQCQTGETTASCPVDCPPQANDRTMSFFITSVGNGTQGGNFTRTVDSVTYTGRAGADKFCQQRAEASTIPSARNKRWVAYLSITNGSNGPGVNSRNAIERIGDGPWYNHGGQEITRTDVLAGISSSIIQDELGGRMVSAAPANQSLVSGDHDVLTGTGSNGMLALFPDNPSAANPTCADWTNGSSVWDQNSPDVAPPYAMVGHADHSATNHEGSVRSWVASHVVPCSLESLRSTAGSGRLYCFAVGNLP